MSGGTRAIRWVLASGAVVFLLSAVVLLVAPGLFSDLLGLVPTEGSDWALRMTGACLIGLGGLLWLVRRADELGIRRAAAVMIVASLAMTILTLAVPAEEWTTLRWAYLGIGGGFAVVYLLLLIVGSKRRLRREDASRE
jgi:peptidoglycan/LPS O-acetylase OafA/YrhL